jgi:membrane-bound lytic murein transglycosylase D
MNRLILHFAQFVLALILLNGCTSTSKKENLTAAKPNPPAYHPVPPAAQNSYSGVFLKPAALEPAVEFWRKTYAVWPRSQVAIHDDRYLDVIYEVFNVPGDVGESLNTEQKEALNQRKDFWRGQLAALESKLRYGAQMNAVDKQLITKLEQSGKPLSFFNGASERVRSQRGTRERFRRGLEISGRYELQFRKIFREAGLPEDLAYLPHVESSFQASAKSSAGAVKKKMHNKIS